ncbi:MAG: radical SAM protein [Candidatus Delongbacteria bacterium]|nr:radical SAM protein [Candidatus Delongbacteria bacterium]
MEKQHIYSKIINQYLHENKLKKPVCKAPFISMSIGMTGFVSPCCYTQSFFAESDIISKYPDHSLMEIWRGKGFKKFRKNLNRSWFPEECQICESDLANGNFKSAKMRMYEGYKKHKKYPVMLEMAIDNTCNLECVMCNSQLSSKIASHKGVKYDNGFNHEQFKAELQPIIPHLQECIFSGGESFLSKTYRDIWRDIIRVNPDCRISVNTNGTVLNDEIKALMEAGIFFLNVSIDSVNKTTYEQIRKGASFEQVMENLSYFLDYSKRKNTILSMPVCPLTLNYKELPDIVEFCNSRGIFLEFVHVFNALNVNLQYAKKEVLEEAYGICSDAQFVVRDQASEHNVNMLKALSEKIRFWIREKEFRESFLSEITLDGNSFIKAMQDFETKIKNYLYATYDRNEAETRYIKWKQKKDDLFKQLPDYLHAAIFYRPMFEIKTSVWYQYVSTMPLDELKVLIQSFGERVISDVGSSENYN